MKDILNNYKSNLKNLVDGIKLEEITNLVNDLEECWKKDRNIFICGNGGSAGNANHIANDLSYGAGLNNGKGLNIESLSANSSVITCLANDTGYENIYSEQVKAKGRKDDLLIILSGSGNSKNVVKAIQEAKKINMKTFSIVGFDGGQCKKLSEKFIHLNINDMQISEDLQLSIFHICMKILNTKKI